MKLKQSIKFVGKCTIVLFLIMLTTILFMISDGSRLMDGLASASVFVTPIVGFLIFNNKP